jgi:hypothetical protein
LRESEDLGNESEDLGKAMQRLRSCFLEKLTRNPLNHSLALMELISHDLIVRYETMGVDKSDSRKMETKKAQRIRSKK